jgi:putative ribosome biogenesis GTPase RsgA
LKDCAHEWEPGCVVYWDVNLKPNEKNLSVTRISAYRIVVLEIRTNVKTRRVV